MKNSGVALTWAFQPSRRAALQRLGLVEALDDVVLAAVGEPAKHRLLLPIGELVVDG